MPISPCYYIYMVKGPNQNVTYFSCDNCKSVNDSRAAEGHWNKNVTYCGGRHDKCTTDIIVTIANVSMPAPGVVNHKYTDAPLDPQVKLVIVVVRIPRNLRYIRGESSTRKFLIYRSHLHE